MKLPRQVSSLYHIIHYLVLAYFFFIAYPLGLRPKAKDNDRAYLFGEGFFLHFGMEVDVFFGMALFLLYDLLKNTRTWDEGMHHFLLDCKILSLVLTFVAGNNYFMFGLVALYSTMAILLVPPRYDGDSNVVVLTHRTFRTKVLQQQSQQPYLVMFHNKWDAKCHFFEPQFCELSLEYPEIKFGSLDVANCSDLAQTFLIEDENGEPQQLPALIMFRNGQEVRRIPQIDDTGKAIQCSIHKDIVIRHFALDTADAVDATDGSHGAHVERTKKTKKKKKTH
ncbi:Thioredoxin-related transmembrane protein [Fragilaria crotonensis]|nr:Thioredoxin-related transmembrane protein [Fragilaria crotonensis]